MKKLFMIAVASLAFMQGAYAEDEDSRLFNHLSIGVNVGTTGIGADVAMPATKWLEIEAGFSIMPKIKYTTDVHLNLPQSTINTINGFINDYKTYNPSSTFQPINYNDVSTVPIQGKLNMVNGKVLINYLPFKKSNFHLTVGAYFGSSDVIEVYNKQDGQLSVVNKANGFIEQANAATLPIPGWTNQDLVGLKLGDYLLTPDANGNAKATLKTKAFKPYVGFGFGRAVPKNKRVGFKFDMGAMFWGTPEVIDHNGTDLAKQDWDGKDGGAFRIISKIKVYPVINFRICGRIF